MMEPSRPSNPELGILESSGLNKTQAGGFVHMMYKSSISKKSASRRVLASHNVVWKCIPTSWVNYDACSSSGSSIDLS